MMLRPAFAASLISLSLLCAGGVQAQMYKWVGADGKITYSDVPPPATAKQVERKAISNTGDADVTGLPAELANAVKNSPVTLYTAPKCSPCGQARAMLVTRGVPFSEKTVVSNDDIEKLRQVSGDAQLPFLQVGSVKQQGFSQDAWASALSSAGYPESSILPKTYRQAPATAAAPPRSAPGAPGATGSPGGEKQAQRGAEALPPAVGNAPPGFRF